MAEIILIRDEAALRRLLTSPQGGVARALARKAQRVTDAAKLIATAEHHVDTGRYRASLSWRLGEDSRGLFADVGSNVTYARYLEFGTPPHLIRPRVKQALFWEGAKHPVRVVHHPGTRPYAILQRALRAAV